MLVFSDSPGTVTQNLTGLSSPSGFYTLSFQYLVGAAAPLTNVCTLTTTLATQRINVVLMNEDSQTQLYTSVSTNFYPRPPIEPFSSVELLFDFDCDYPLTLLIDNVALVAQTPASYNSFPS